MDLDAIDQGGLEALGALELRALVGQLIERAQSDRADIVRRDAHIARLTAEIATLKRIRFGARSERMDASQQLVFDEAFAADLAALETELERVREQAREQAAADAPVDRPARPRRAPLPAHLPRVEIRHEPKQTDCACGAPMQRVGEDITEKLDYEPGTFTVERHVRGKWTCRCCRTLVQAPVAACIIDKGIPTPGLLAQVLVAKASDHLPLYRQEQVFARAGFAIPRSTLAAWFGAAASQLVPLAEALKRQQLTRSVLHADETPVALLDPGSGRTRKAYLWAYATGVFEPLRAVVYDFCEGRSGAHARAYLGHGEASSPDAWRGTLICDDYSGYSALFDRGIIEAGCFAHARRRFFDLHKSNASTIAATAVEQIQLLYNVERRVRDLHPDERLRIRQEQAAPIATHLHRWLIEQRVRVPDGGGIAGAIDYSLKRWKALTHYLLDPMVPIGGVEMWRGGRRSRLSVSAPFVWRCPSTLAVAPFPHPPHRIGRADLPHPALFRHIRPSHSSGRVRTAAGVSVPTSHRGTGRSTGGTPFPACRCVFAARSADAARCSRQWAGRCSSPVLD